MTGRGFTSWPARHSIRSCISGSNDVLLFGLTRPATVLRACHPPSLKPSTCRGYSTRHHATRHATANRRVKAEGTRIPPPKKSNRRLILAGLFLTGTLFYLTSSSSSASSSSASATLNNRTFVPYTIVKRVAMSPSSFVLTVSPDSPNPDPPYLLPSSNRWRHPLWSVEFKQPEVQISRHYTPLPPASSSSSSSSSSAEEGQDSSSSTAAERKGHLRFYIRAVGEGEMSRYLSRLREGHTVWLRGPHVGFDLVRRLGASKSIVFLAGGTGVVPGMQAARVVLDGFEDSRVSLLWAVRKREEIQLGGGGGKTEDTTTQSGGWLGFGKAKRVPAELDVRMARPSPVAAQLASMKTQYGDRLSVQVVVDEEHTSFDKDHIQSSLSLLTSDNTGAGASSADPTGSCSLHNQKMHEQASEFESDSPVCRCSPTDGVIPGKNLFVVSGPEGFVSHYAGAKIWSGGRQRQGPVGGVLDAIQKANPQLAQDWLILKL